MVRSMKLAEWFETEGKGKGVTRTAFAQKIDVTPSYITALCNGSVWPGRDVASRIAEATEGAVSANDFVARDGPEHPQAVA